PTTLLASALQRHPQPGSQRQPFLDRALALLEQRSQPLGPEDLHTKALIYHALGRPTEAVANYQAALALEPRQERLRLELARLLSENNQLQESRRELLHLLSQQPGQAGARELLTDVERQIAEGR